MTSQQDQAALAEWLQGPLGRVSDFRVSLSGVPGRLRLPAQWHGQVECLPQHLLYAVTGGEIRGQVNETNVRVGAGQVLWMGPGCRVSLQPHGHQPLSILRFRLQMVTSTGQVVAAPWPFAILDGGATVLEWTARLVDEASSAPEDAALGQLKLRGLLYCLFAELARPAAPVPGGGQLTPAQRRSLESFVASAAGARATPAQLAAQVRLSPDYFARCFRRSYGVAPRRWVVEERVRQAALRLLEGRATVSQVAHEFSYPDVFAFSRQFKSVLGQSPAAYRAAHSTLESL